MASRTEQLPKGQETGKVKPESLIFNTAEEAGDFLGRVEKEIKQKSSPGVARKREVMGEELANEIAKYGEETVDTTQPWEHTPEEHREVQGLVEMAFRENLSLALRKARKSDNYPRLIDLFHDVLTGQMYEALVKAGVNKQAVGRGVWVGLGAVGLLIVIALLILIAF